jgi:hypothetical protein
MELLDCPLRWKKKHLDGMRLPSTPPAMIGTAVHASTAAFDQSAIDGAGLTIDDTAGIAVDSLRNPDEEVDWMGVSAERAEETALRVHTRYCIEIAPEQNYTIVEHTLSPLQIEMENGIVFELTGTLDRIRQDDLGRSGVADVKTGAAAVSPDGQVVVGKHLPQLGEYELLAEQEFGPMDLPASIIGLHTGRQARVGFREVKGAKSALIGDGIQPGLLHYVAPYFKSGLFPPNPGSLMCSARYCPYYDNCNFHG